MNGDGPTFKVGEPGRFSRFASSRSIRASREMDITVTHDGKRFLVSSLPEAPERQQINVIVNWMADFK